MTFSRRTMFISALILFFVLTRRSAAQEPARPPAAEVKDSKTIVRVTSNAVRLDVFVTDKHGNPVSGLTSKDFEILRNDEPQEILTCSQVLIAETARRIKTQPGRQAVNSDRETPAVPGVDKRWISIVINDLGMSFIDIARVRMQLKKFVERDVGPHDAMSIMQVSGGRGFLLPFTSDKRVLAFLVDQIRFQLRGPACFTCDYDSTGVLRSGIGYQSALGMIDAFFLSLQPRMREMESLPGKKAIIVLDTPIQGSHSDTAEYERRMGDVLGRFSDHAVRTGTSVYVFNVAGLEIGEILPAITAGGGTPPRPPWGLAGTLGLVTSARSWGQQGGPASRLFRKTCIGFGKRWHSVRAAS